LGRHTVPSALRAAGAHVEAHADHFPEDAPDDVWLTEVGATDSTIETGTGLLELIEGRGEPRTSAEPFA
jgi:hypothetical protein